MDVRAVALLTTMTACWPYISGPYEGTDGDADTDVDTDVDTDTDTDTPPGDLIADLRSGAIPVGSNVAVRDVDVTGVWDLGFSVQDPRGGNSSAGLVVFVGVEHDVSVGDRVNVEGEVMDYFGELQLNIETSPTIIGSGLRVTPLQLPSARASEEQFEGMLIEVNGSVTDTDYDCSLDGTGCTDTGLWEIGGSSGVVVFDRMYEDFDWGSHIADTPVVGVTTWRWQRRRLMPRTADDFGR